MDTVHDLGGLQGFGPVAVDADERPFHHDWEARMWGLNEAMTGDPAWTLDWWRHVRELIQPIDYLTRPYFDQWAQVYAALLIDSGMARFAELASGETAEPKRGINASLPKPMSAAEVPAASRRTADFRREGAPAPRFAAGASVRVTADPPAIGHTRLPRYLRGRPGTIHAYRGNHLLPDAGAKGREVAEPLYTIAFRAADLWPEAGASHDRVFADLWESYLER